MRSHKLRVCILHVSACKSAASGCRMCDVLPAADPWLLQIQLADSPSQPIQASVVADCDGICFAGASSQLVLPAVARHQFTSLEEVTQQPDHVHCLPKKKTLQSVDFLRQPDDMGQVTIDLGHGAKAAGLRAAHDVLRAGQTGQPVHLTFVVPPDRYDNFPRQNIGRIDRKRYPISQRVLKMPLSGRALALLL